MRIVFHFQACVGDCEPIDDEIICFQVRLCPYLCNNFISVSVLETLFPSLKDAKICQIGLGLTCRTPAVFGTNQTCLLEPQFAEVF